MDTEWNNSAKLSFLTRNGRRFYFGDICQFIVTIGNKKHSLNTAGNIITMTNKGGKGCRRRRAEKRAMNKERRHERIEKKPIGQEEEDKRKEWMIKK